MEEYINKIGRSVVPAYSMLEDYLWVDDFLKLLDLQEEMKALRQRKKDLRLVNPTKEDLIKQVEEQYQEYKKQRVDFIAREFILQGRKGRLASVNPFNHMKFERDSVGFFPYVTLEEVREAIDTLPDEGITNQEKGNQMEAVESRLSEIRIEMDELSPPVYFHLVDGRVTDDIRESFFRHWLSIQGKVCAPCGPQGIILDKSSFEEKQAWEKLGIGRAMAPKSRNVYPNLGLDNPG